jgi:hypothetical protein
LQAQKEETGKKAKKLMQLFGECAAIWLMYQHSANVPSFGECTIWHNNKSGNFKLYKRLSD